MSHIRKLMLTGHVCETKKKVSSYYSWPAGEKQYEVEKIIHNFRKAFCGVTVVIHHNDID